MDKIAEYDQGGASVFAAIAEEGDPGTPGFVSETIFDAAGRR